MVKNQLKTSFRSIIKAAHHKYVGSVKNPNVADFKEFVRKNYQAELKNHQEATESTAIQRYWNEFSRQDVGANISGSNDAQFDLLHEILPNRYMLSLPPKDVNEKKHIQKLTMDCTLQETFDHLGLLDKHINDCSVESFQIKEKLTNALIISGNDLSWTWGQVLEAETKRRNKAA